MSYDSSALLSDLLSAGTAGLGGAARAYVSPARQKSRDALAEGEASLRTIINDVPKNDHITAGLLRRHALLMRDMSRTYADHARDGELVRAGASGVASGSVDAIRPVGNHRIATPLAALVGQLAATALLDKVSPSAGLMAHGAASAGGALAARLGLRGYDALTERSDPADAFGKTSAEKSEKADKSLASIMQRRFGGAATGALATPAALYAGGSRMDLGQTVAVAPFGAPIGAYAAGGGVLPLAGALLGTVGADHLISRLNLSPYGHIGAKLPAVVAASGVGAGLGEYADNYLGDKFRDLKDRLTK